MRITGVNDQCAGGLTAGECADGETRTAGVY